jgi:hypothetical protein
MGLIARTGKMRDAYNTLVGTPKGKRDPLTDLRIDERSNEMCLKGMGFEDVKSIKLPRVRVQCRALVKTVMKI